MKDIAVASPELAVAEPISNAILIFLPGLQLFCNVMYALSFTSKLPSLINHELSILPLSTKEPAFRFLIKAQSRNHWIHIATRI